MKKASLTALIFLVMLGSCSESIDNQPNTLTEIERQEGWQLLFDGKTLDGWRGINRDDVPSCWIVANGELAVNAGVADSEDKGDIISKEMFADFDLKLEWKMGVPGGNSGIKYYVLESLSKGSGGIGLEYQILDDQNHPAVLSGQIKPNDYHTLGALYEIYEPSGEKIVKQIGEWNESRIISKGHHVEHWLNGKKILEYERGSQDFRDRVAKSKFKNIDNFGEADKGHILLQEHGGALSFRNIKIKRL